MMTSRMFENRNTDKFYISTVGSNLWCFSRQMNFAYRDCIIDTSMMHWWFCFTCLKWFVQWSYGQHLRYFIPLVWLLEFQRTTWRKLLGKLWLFLYQYLYLFINVFWTIRYFYALPMTFTKYFQDVMSLRIFWAENRCWCIPRH